MNGINEINTMRKLTTTTRKVNAWETFILTFTTKSKESTSVVLPLCNFETEESMDISNVIFHTEITALKDKLNINDTFHTVADFTDDPTSHIAGGIVSLGYPLIRIVLQNSKISSFDPLIISGKTKDLKVQHNRCQRSSLIKMPRHETVNKDVRINKLTVKRDYYIMPIAFEKPVYTISCITGIENLTTVSLLNMTTFYHRPQIIYAKKHRTIEVAHEDYEKLKKRWIKYIA